ncbi:helix-turn-helix domain-containing protein [Microbacterium pumilum]|uniref:Helix-turn-helix domain-containing protein n=1 Tax=Microbacterium pumilum TaxID=344165 RepID=A0ABN2T298_9MICO
MSSAIIQQVSDRRGVLRPLGMKVLDAVRPVSVDLAYLTVMNSEQLSGLGLEPMVTTSELAEYLRVDVQAIYDLRLHDRGPKGVRVGRELRFRVSDVKRWLDSLHEPDSTALLAGSER